MWWTPLLRWTIECHLKTLKVEETNSRPFENLLKAMEPFVLIFWHGSMYYPWWRVRHRRVASLVSRSRDGQILSDVLSGWGYHLIRGSSSKGSREAMESMRGAIAGRHVLCVTPDGPRGPRHAMKMGAVRVAQTMNVPLVGVALGYSGKKTLRSWDGFEIPLPFATAVVEYSDPLRIDPDQDDAHLDRERCEIELMMKTMHDKAGRRARGA